MYHVLGGDCRKGSLEGYTELACVLFALLAMILLLAWNTNVNVGASAATLDHKMNLRVETTC